MIQAKYEDKEIVIDILANSFLDNKSVNYIIKQDTKKLLRIRELMAYAFDVCFLSGSILISENQKGCALVSLPFKQKTSFKKIFLDAKLILKCCGITNLRKVLKREFQIKSFHPEHPYKHLWFIGVHPKEQNNGTGSRILKHVINDDLPVYLETSTLKNIPWYKKHGFEIYNELDFGYKLYLLKKSK